MIVFAIFTLILVIFAVVEASPSLLGIGKGGVVVTTSPLAGATFNLTRSSSGMSAIEGKGLQVNLDSLEVAGSGGVFKYSPLGAEFRKGSGIWNLRYAENNFAIDFKNSNMLKMEAGDSNVFQVFGTGVFSDLLLSKAESVKILENLCFSDRTISGSNEKDISACSQDISNTHLTVLQHLDYMGKLMIASIRNIIALKNQQNKQGETEALQASMTQLSTTFSQSLTTLQEEIMRNNRYMQEDIKSSANNASDSMAKAHEVVAALQQQVDSLLLTNATMFQVIEQMTVDYGNVTARMEELEAQQQLSSQHGEQIAALNATVYDLYELSLASASEKMLNVSEEWRLNHEQLEKQVESTISFIQQVNQSEERNMAALNELRNITVAASEAVELRLNEVYAEFNESRVLQETALLQQQLESKELLNNATAALRVEIAEVEGNMIKYQSAVAANHNETLYALESLRNHSETQLTDTANNISSAIARSNSLLVKVIADVNATLYSHTNETQSDLQTMNATLFSLVANETVKIYEAIETKQQEFEAQLIQLSSKHAIQLEEQRNLSKIATETMQNSTEASLAAVEERIKNITAELDTIAERDRELQEKVANLTQLQEISTSTLNDTFQRRFETLQELQQLQNISLVGRIQAAYGDLLNITHSLHASMDSADASLRNATDAVKLQLETEIKQLEEQLEKQQTAYEGTLLHLRNEMHERLNNSMLAVDNTTNLLKLEDAALRDALNGVNATLLQQLNSTNEGIDQQVSELSAAVSLSLAGMANATNSSISAIHQEFSSGLARMNETLQEEVDALHHLHMTHLLEFQGYQNETARRFNESSIQSMSDLQALSRKLQNDLNALNESTIQSFSGLNSSITAQIAKLNETRIADVASLKAALDAATAQSALQVIALNHSINLLQINSSIELNNVRKELGSELNLTSIQLMSYIDHSINTQEKAQNESFSKLQALVDARLVEQSAAMQSLAKDTNAKHNATGAQLLQLTNNVTAWKAEQMSSMTAVSALFNQSLLKLQTELTEQIDNAQDGTTAKLIAMNQTVHAVAANTTAEVKSLLHAEATRLNSTAAELKAFVEKSLDTQTKQQTTAQQALSTQFTALESEVTALSAQETLHVAKLTESTEALKLQLLNLTHKHDLTTVGMENKLQLVETAVTKDIHALTKELSAARNATAAVEAKVSVYQEQQNKAEKELESKIHKTSTDLILLESMVKLHENQSTALQTQQLRQGDNITQLFLTHKALETKLSTWEAQQSEFKHLWVPLQNITVPAVQMTLKLHELELKQLQNQSAVLISAFTAEKDKIYEKILNISVQSALTDVSVTQLNKQLSDESKMLSQKVDAAQNSSNQRLAEVAAYAHALEINQTRHVASIQQLERDVLKLNNNLEKVEEERGKQVETNVKLAAQVEELQAAQRKQQEQNKEFLTMMKEMKDAVDKQTLVNAALEMKNKQQSEEIAALQEENRRLLREYAPLETVESLRKLLFEMQGSFITHSQKVLDLVIVDKQQEQACGVKPCPENVK